MLFASHAVWSFIGLCHTLDETIETATTRAPSAMCVHTNVKAKAERESRQCAQNLSVKPYRAVQGVEGELTKSEDARTARSGCRCTRLVDGYTSRTVRCIPVFVRSEKSNAFVGDGLLRFELPGQLTLHTPYLNLLY